jgi:hypothetical protein
MTKKYIEAARADYEALHDDEDMIGYLAEIYAKLHALDPANHHIDAHWSFAEAE